MDCNVPTLVRGMKVEEALRLLANLGYKPLTESATERCHTGPADGRQTTPHMTAKANASDAFSRGCVNTAALAVEWHCLRGARYENAALREALVIRPEWRALTERWDEVAKTAYAIYVERVRAKNAAFNAYEAALARLNDLRCGVVRAPCLTGSWIGWTREQCEAAEVWLREQTEAAEAAANTAYELFTKVDIEWLEWVRSQPDIIRVGLDMVGVPVMYFDNGISIRQP